MPVLHPVLKWLSPNISLAVGKEKASAVGTDFQGFALSQCGTFLKSEKKMAFLDLPSAVKTDCPAN